MTCDRQQIARKTGGVHETGARFGVVGVRCEFIPFIVRLLCAIGFDLDQPDQTARRCGRCMMRGSYFKVMLESTNVRCSLQSCHGTVDVYYLR
jgi:hypothetical protein